MLITLDFGTDIPQDFKLLSNSALDEQPTLVTNRNAQKYEQDWKSALIIGQVFINGCPKVGLNKLLRMIEGMRMKITYTENLAAHVKSLKITTRNEGTPMIMNIPEDKNIYYSIHKNNYNKYFCIEFEFQD